MEVENSNAIITPSSDQTAASPSIFWGSSKGPVPSGKDNSGLRRHDFPKGFIFGAGTSAYQVEGAAAKGGKGISIWDEFTNSHPYKITDRSNGNVACDMYNRYKEDIQMMKKMGFDSYRFSISWPRILPGGRCTGGINREGIDYYNDVINTVLAHDMIPFVTLFHWDLPNCLEKEYGGFLSKRVKDDFKEFAEVCFWEFGDRVKHWTTINEPWTYAVKGYVSGDFPPGRKIPAPQLKLFRKLPSHRTLNPPEATTPNPSHDGDDNNFVKADPADSYTVGRNLLLAHAEAVKLYRDKFQEFQDGQIGIVLNSHWFVPYDKNSETDKAAALRAVDFMFGWFLDPVLSGSYPESMINNVPPDNLANFTPQESEMLKGSIDFLGLNYYTAQYVKYDPHPLRQESGYYVDQKADFSSKRGDEYIGDDTGSKWLYVVPWGIYELLQYLHDNKNLKIMKEIYITENGVSTTNDPKLTAKEVCNNDNLRTKYYQNHLANLLKVMEDKQMKNIVKGYFVWSWCDNFEWNTGYTARFGIIYIDYMNDLTRYPKDSAAWFAKFLKREKSRWPWPFLSKKRSLVEENEEDEIDKRLKVVQKYN